MEATKPKDLDIDKFIKAENAELLTAVQIMQAYLAFGGYVDRARMEAFVKQYEK